MENNIDFSEISNGDEWFEYELNINFNTFRLIASHVEELLDMNNSIDKLTYLIDEKCDLSNMVSQSYNEEDTKRNEAIKGFIVMVDNEIEKLETLQRTGLLATENVSKKFQSTLSDNQLTKIYEYLINKGYIETELVNWLSWFNGLSEIQKPMKWNKSNQSLSNIFSLICITGSHRPLFEAFGIKVNKQDRYDKIVSTTYGKALKNRIDINN